MKSICFFFHIHVPFRLKKYRFFDIEHDHYYYDEFQNEENVKHIVENSFLPANRTIAEMIRSSNGKFRCAFSISGPSIELFEQYAPELIDSFKELANTGSVEFLAMPYAYSLSSVFDSSEFERQVKLHSLKIQELFAKKPTTLLNTELIYSDEIGDIAAKMGFKTMILDEAKHVMGWKSPNYIYSHAYLPKLKLIVRNQKLSDDLAFRFNQLSLNAETYAQWLAGFPAEENIVNIGIGYQVFGITQPAYTGIFEFIKALPYHVMEKEMTFALPSEVSKKNDATGSLTSTYPISWVGNDKDLTPWTGNDLQNEMLNKLYAVSERVRLCSDKPLQHDWLNLQSADNFRYMSHKDAYGTNYESPYEAFINYSNILADFLFRVDAQYPTTIENEELSELLKTINHQEEEIERLEIELKKAKARKAKKEEE